MPTGNETSFSCSPGCNFTGGFARNNFPGSHHSAFAIRDGWISPPLSHIPAVRTLLSVQQGWNPPWTLPAPPLYCFLRGPLGPTALLQHRNSNSCCYSQFPYYHCSSIRFFFILLTSLWIYIPVTPCSSLPSSACVLKLFPSQTLIIP